jgi:hypothetical protein
MADSMQSSLVWSPPETHHTQWDSSGWVISLNLTTHNTHKRQTSITPGRIRTHNLSKRTAADLHPTLHIYWDQPFWHLVDTKYSSGLSFTAPMCSSLKCLFIICLQKSDIRCMKDRVGVRIYNVWKSNIQKSRTACTHIVCTIKLRTVDLQISYRSRKANYNT